MRTRFGPGLSILAFACPQQRYQNMAARIEPTAKSLLPSSRSARRPSRVAGSREFPVSRLQWQGPEAEDSSWQERIGSPVKLLVVEDEKKTASYLRKGLTESGFTVDVAEKGEEGLHLARTGDYDVIVLDIMLPGGRLLASCAAAANRFQSCS